MTNSFCFRFEALPLEKIHIEVLLVMTPCLLVNGYCEDEGSVFSELLLPTYHTTRRHDIEDRNITPLCPQDAECFKSVAT
jgi:hypothetical protein